MRRAPGGRGGAAWSWPSELEFAIVPHVTNTVPPPTTPKGRSLLLAIAILAVIAVDSFRPIANYDIHWHLAAGRIMLERGEVLTTDPLSWTIQGRRWVNHEWLAQVLFALAERAGGLTGVRLLTAGVVALAFLALHLLAWRATRHPWESAAVVMFGFVLYLFRVQERPHVWTPLLFFCVYGILLREDLSAFRKAATAVVVAALWANVHAGALLTPFLLGAFALGSLRSDRRGAATYAMASLLSAAAVCVTPNGWAIWEFALVARSQTHLVPEWRSVWSFESGLYGREKILFVLACLAWGITLWRRRDAADPRETWASILAFALATSAIRFLFFLVVPVLQVARLQRGRVVTRWGALVLVALQAWIVWAELDDRADRYGRAGIGLFDDVYYPHYPVQAVDYLSEVKLEGHGFVHPWWAGYLSWRLWPGYLTFVDGRTPDFGNELCEDALAMWAGPREERERLFDKHGIEWLLAPRPYFGQDEGACTGRWVRVHADDLAVVYVRNDGPHAARNGEAVIEHARKREGR